MQRLQQSGELLEQHTDPLTHALARQQHGVTKGSVDAAVAEGKIPLLLTDVEGAEAARARGLDCWCIFLAPASPEVQHRPKLCIICHLTLVARRGCHHSHCSHCRAVMLMCMSTDQTTFVSG